MPYSGIWRETATQPPGVLVVGRRLAAKLGKEPRITASFDGPSVAEEVQPVLHRLMNALSELQARAGRNGPFAVTVFAHREGEKTKWARAPFFPFRPDRDLPPAFPTRRC